MVRLVVVVQRPHHLGMEQAEVWLLRQVDALGDALGVRRVDLTRLSSPSLRFGREWDWLLELYLEDGEDARRAADQPAWAELLGDLRVLGMRPSVAIVEGTIAVRGGD